MISLSKNKNMILQLKTKVENKDPSLFSHTCINNNNINNNTISIVMTSSNRSKQTYFTLKTISTSKYKNIQIIIVDDSDIDPINIDVLKKENYNFYIDIIRINRKNKNWHNPLVNYNIGFRYIKGNIIVIQNAEVCHIGDILSFINNNVINDNYYVFDVKASLNFTTNETIYNSNISNTDIYNKHLFEDFYQSQQNNKCYHFLTALSKYTFDKIQHFSYDCTMGSAYDDDDFLFKIKSTKINVINIWHDKYQIGGIHLYHIHSRVSWDTNVESNNELVYFKKQIYNHTGEYVDVSENKNDFDEKLHRLLCQKLLKIKNIK